MSYGKTMVKTLENSAIKQPHLLLVEGIEDAVFFEAIIKKLSLTSIEIWPIGIRRKLKDNLRLLTMLSGFENVISIGIIQDADDDPSAAFDSIRQAITDNGLSAPESYGGRSAQTPITRVLIIPDGLNSRGMLESLCLKAIEDDPAMPCIDAYFDCLNKIRIFQRTVDKDKAKVHAYLASREKPDKRLGEAASANYWPFDNSVFDNVKRFLFEVGNLR